MMTPQEEERLEFLKRGACTPLSYFKDYYGLDWPLTSEAGEDFLSWQKRFRKPTTCPEAEPSRYELEAFLQQQRVLPRKWMAARLGMEIDSLDEILKRLPELGLRTQRYLVYPELVSESLEEDLITHLPGLKFRTFGDHDDFCERLHAELKDTIGIEVKKLLCDTSVRLDEYTPSFANNFDCITLKPLSTKHQVWLDFRKPLTLPPDRCSKHFYVTNREILRPFCAGSREPDGLERYEGHHVADVRG
jgi:hypothetical protein